MATYAVSARNSTEPDFLDRLHHDSRRLIETELRRLSRRVPTLDADDLAVVAEALAELTDALILDRLSRAPSETTPLLCRLFGGKDDEVTASALSDHGRSDSRRAASINWSRRGRSSSRPGSQLSA